MEKQTDILEEKPDQKTIELVKELMNEKISLDPALYPNASKLLDEEIVKAQKGKSFRDLRMPVDVYRERPVRCVVKVQVPVKEHPRFNFVGKLLGPKGNSLKRLQEETMTKMAILGRGSMKDKQKEEECRASLDPKYAHLSDELHIEIAALAPPAEAHARLAYALAELRKYLVPDANDEIRLEQLREIEADGVPKRPQTPRGILQRPNYRISNPIPRPAPTVHPPQANFFRPSTPAIGGSIIPRSVPPPGKAKILSILDKARIAMEEPYQQQYDPLPERYDYDNNGSGSYYEQEYSEVTGMGVCRWKGYKSVGPSPTREGRYPLRAAPYSRPAK